MRVLNDAIDAVTNGGTTGGILSASFGVFEGNVNASDSATMDSLLEQYSLSGLKMFAARGDHGSVCVDGSGNSYPTTITVPPHVAAIVTQPVVNVGGSTSLDSVNLTFPWTPPKPVSGCTGTKCR